MCTPDMPSMTANYVTEAERKAISEKNLERAKAAQASGAYDTLSSSRSPLVNGEGAAAFYAMKQTRMEVTRINREREAAGWGSGRRQEGTAAEGTRMPNTGGGGGGGGMAGSTLLTGPSGVDTSTANLSKKSLLGA